MKKRINYDTYMQIKLPKKLKELAKIKSKNNLSDYIRKLIKNDCENSL